jgi:hypothetical protein
LQWAAVGKSNTDIGTILNISDATVAYFLQRFFATLDANSKTLAVVKALRLGLTVLDPHHKMLGIMYDRVWHAVYVKRGVPIRYLSKPFHVDDGQPIIIGEIETSPAILDELKRRYADELAEGTIRAAQVEPSTWKTSPRQGTAGKACSWPARSPVAKSAMVASGALRFDRCCSHRPQRSLTAASRAGASAATHDPIASQILSSIVRHRRQQETRPSDLAVHKPASVYLSSRMIQEQSPEPEKL